MSWEWVLIVVLVISFACGAGIVIDILITTNKRGETIVRENSERLRWLKLLNARTHYFEIESLYMIREYCVSKQKLDRLDMDTYFVHYIEKRLNWFHRLEEETLENHETKQIYMSEVIKINSTATEESCKALKIKLKKFIKLENMYFEQEILQIEDNPVICIKASYTSPQGRNTYQRTERYRFIEIQDMVRRTENLIEERGKREYQIRLERAKLTPSMRYNILKRDHFRCQICGSSSSDGVKLHVDHIVPVSRGGKTEPSNLRTLCDRCNLGKSSKLE